ncbi:MAG TPA: hypothetical protein VEA99_19325 [Gemmatimonadaceae bacterium]|nr:hypothetical protein [Gemmatimonadaceae bacterium]
MRPVPIAARLALAALATAALTWFVGWWGVVVVALVAGALPARLGLGAGAMALAGALGWASLLAVQATHPDFPLVLDRVGSVFRVPGVAVLLVSLLFVALLGWSAAVVGGAVGRVGTRRPAPVTNAPAAASPSYEPAESAPLRSPVG